MLRTLRLCSNNPRSRIIQSLTSRSFSSSNDEFNFFKEASNFSSQSNKNLVGEETGEFDHLMMDADPYSSESHSLIPYLYLYRFYNDNVGYVLMEPKTRDLIAVDVGEFDKSYKIISELEKRHDTQLRYILSTHHHPDHIGANL
jgi:hypothetical protein